MTITIPFAFAILFIVMFSLIVLITSITMITLFVLYRKYKRQSAETDRLLYFNLKHSSDVSSQMDYLIESIEHAQSDVNQLSEQLHIKIQKDQEEANRRIWPKPDLAKQITDTIEEQLAIQFVLNRNQKSPRSDALNIITENTIKTYPNVSIDYITHKCIAVVEQGISETIKPL